jgi:hypothetical protein
MMLASWRMPEYGSIRANYGDCGLSSAETHSRSLEKCFSTTPAHICERQDRAISVVAGAVTIEAFVRLFKERGLPRAIRSDNGLPFASPNGLYNLSKLSVFWLRLGIAIERIRPGHPQQNGRHERMHLTLKKETTRPPGMNALQQQARFDAFLSEFNEERPHEGIDMRVPAELYTSSSRAYEGLPEVEYPFHDKDILVTACGRICMMTNLGVALVTGASTGIGHATAKALQNADSRVFGTGRRTVAAHVDARKQPLSELEPAMNTTGTADQPRSAQSNRSVAMINLIGGVAAFGLAASPLHAGELSAMAGESIHLGRLHGVFYYTDENDGYRVIATVTDGEAGSPVRFTATLADGQSATISVAGKLGETGQRDVALWRQAYRHRGGIDIQPAPRSHYRVMPHSVAGACATSPFACTPGAGNPARRKK